LSRSVAFLTAMAVLVVTGLVHGLWTDRWSWSSEPGSSVAKLANIPALLGDWENVEELPLDAREQEAGGIAGYVIRRYVHRQTHREVQMFLVCGRPGQISVHTPDVCFEGAGYEFPDSPQPKIAGGPDNHFWMSDCTKQTGALPERYRIYWSWNADGTWQAPKEPRLTFARHKALFKLYVVEKLAPLGEASDKDAALDFIGQLLPELKKCLFGS
jgi:hypothetical protein